MPKKKIGIIKFLKKHAWTTGYVGLILTIFLAVWSIYNPNVIVIQNENREHTINVVETSTQTITITTTVTATVTRADGTVEDLTIPTS